MKSTFTFLSAALLSASAVTFIALTVPAKKIDLTVSGRTHAGTENEAEERMRWEIMRLADPATGKIPDNMRMKELAYAATLPNDADANSVRGMAGLTWLNRGPWNVGGRTRACAIDVANENRILAGSCSGGMWLSTDGGTSWTMTNTASQLKNATCVAQDTRPGHRNTWYYGSGEAYGASATASGSNGYFQGDGLFKSTDNGVTWVPIASTAGGSPTSFSTSWQCVWNVAVDVSAHDTVNEVYAAALNSVFRSVNGGTTWTTILSGGSYYADVAVDTAGVMYATQSSDGSQKGIWRSPDGITLTNITPPGFPATYNRMVIGINPNNRNEVYFLGNTPNSGKITHDYYGDPVYSSLWKYTYVSGDGSGAGGTWQDLSVNLPATGGPFDKWNTQNSYDMVVRVKPGSSNTVFIGGTNLYRSTSGFQDSTSTTYIGGYNQGAVMPDIGTYPNHHSDQHDVIFYPSDPNKMISANDGGVYRTTDNSASTVVWSNLNNGYLTSMFYAVAVDHAVANNNIVVGGTQDNGTWYTNTKNPTDNWGHIYGGDGSYCAVADSQKTFYFSIQLGKIQMAKVDAGGNKTAVARIDPRGGKGYLFINPFTLDPNNNNIMYLAGGKYLWRNNDLSGIPLVNNLDSISTNWTKFADSVPTANSRITAVTACKTPANRVYYGTDKKKLYRVDNANTGTPTPVDITSVTTTALFPAAGYISCVAADPTDGNKVIVVFCNYNIYSIFYSTDAGVTWTKSAGNLEQNSSGTGLGSSIRWVSILPVADGKVYLAGTSAGLYATDTLNGLNTVWVQQGTNSIGNAVCDMIDTRVADGLVVVGTHANGIYSTNITSVNDIVTVKDLAVLKNDLQLGNYPNPVSQSTTIEFTLNKKTAVNLQIWDECGRIVETLVNETMPEGKHTVQFDRKNLRAGMYYYSLTAENRRKTNKMIIVK